MMMLSECACALLLLLCVCGWDAAGNSIGEVVEKRVADALHLGVLARITAARCRLALAKGLSSRLCEQSVLRDIPHICMSRYMTAMPILILLNMPPASMGPWWWS